MAINLFTKTYTAHQRLTSATSETPEFLICEQDDARAEAFIHDIRSKGGAELAGRVNRVGNGRE